MPLVLVKLPKIKEVRFRWTRDLAGAPKNVHVEPNALLAGTSASRPSSRCRLHGTPILAQLDRGIVHAHALSDGRFVDAPREQLNALDRRARRHAQQVARSKRGSKRSLKARRRLRAVKRVRHASSCPSTTWPWRPHRAVPRHRGDRSIAREGDDGERLRLLDEPGSGFDRRPETSRSVFEIQVGPARDVPDLRSS